MNASAPHGTDDSASGNEYLCAGFGEGCGIGSRNASVDLDLYVKSLSLYFSFQCSDPVVCGFRMVLVKNIMISFTRTSRNTPKQTKQNGSSEHARAEIH